jgi:hypothetical protein
MGEDCREETRSECGAVSAWAGTHWSGDRFAHVEHIELGISGVRALCVAYKIEVARQHNQQSPPARNACGCTFLRHLAAHAAVSAVNGCCRQSSFADSIEKFLPQAKQQ